VFSNCREKIKIEEEAINEILVTLTRNQVLRLAMSKKSLKKKKRNNNNNNNSAAAAASQGR
jgi:ribosomal protein L19E